MSAEKIAVLFGGPSTESEISRRSANNVYDALKEKNYDVVRIELGPNIVDDLRKNAITRVYVITHGNPGEDGTVQGLLELMRIPYTYSDVLASALALNKKKAKEIMMFNGVPVLDDAFIDRRNTDWQDPTWIAYHIEEELGYPVILKPNREGSSVGVKILRSTRELLEAVPEGLTKFGAVIIEPLVEGREITVGVLENADGKLTSMPIIELIPKNKFYDFEAKYTKGMTEYVCPADFHPHLAQQIGEAAVKAFAALGCSSAARVDFIVKGDEFWVLEVNTIPGMTDTSDLPMAAKAMGIPFVDLVERILRSARLKQ